jgi:hypothetical protein
MHLPSAERRCNPTAPLAHDPVRGYFVFDRLPAPGPVSMT